LCVGSHEGCRELAKTFARRATSVCTVPGGPRGTRAALTARSCAPASTESSSSRTPSRCCVLLLGPREENDGRVGRCRESDGDGRVVVGPQVEIGREGKSQWSTPKFCDSVLQ